MKVKLRRTWFTPRGTRLRKGTHDGLPDGWENQLPSDAKVLDYDEPDIEPVETERDERFAYDEQRAADEETARIIQSANDAEALRIKTAADQFENEKAEALAADEAANKAAAEALEADEAANKAAAEKPKTDNMAAARAAKAAKAAAKAEAEAAKSKTENEGDDNA